ncbi:MAG: hypothetical protein ACI8X5_002988 [Planctomycetota bacterium]
MYARIRAILIARLRAHTGGEIIPAAALLAQGSLIGALALMVRGDMSAWGYSLFTLSLGAGLVAMTLLGEFGSLLREDPAAAWADALPASAFERRAGHALAVLVLLTMLSVGVLLPAALLAPSEMDVAARALLLLAGAGQAIALGSVLLALQALFGERIEGVLVLVQTTLVVAAVTGLLNAPGMVPTMLAFEEGTQAWPSLLSWFPPSWYASAVSPGPAGAALPGTALVFGGTLLALALLFWLPPATNNRSRKSATLLTRALSPLRSLATKFWIAPDERGPFDLVYDALPLERDFVLRTYPMIGIPLAFLVAGADTDGGQGMQDLLALLLFTPAVYLPVLLAHVPVSSSPEARWILEGAPIHPEAIEGGAIKALAVRFLLPLYLLLTSLAIYFAGPLFALRLALPGALTTMICLRLLYPRCTLAMPLSTSAADIEVRHDWTGFLLSLAMGLTLLAITAQRMITSLGSTLALVGALLAVEYALGRRERKATNG